MTTSTSRSDALCVDVVFAHDHKMLRCSGRFHDKGGLFRADALRQYKSVFGRVHLVCRIQEAEKTNLPVLNTDHLRIVAIPNIRTMKGLCSLFKARKLISSAVRDADFVIARLPSTIGLIAAAEGYRQRKPCLLEIVGHAGEANVLHGSWLGKLAGPIEHALTKRVVRRAARSVYITEGYLQSVYPCDGQSFVCPNVAVRPLAEKDVRVRPNGSNRVIGLVGSLDVAYKGHDTALRVLARLVRDHGMDNVTLQFLGRGDAARWEAEAAALGMAGKVRCLGGLPPGDAVLSWMDSVDLLLQPSLTEGQGRSIVEAMSRGRPVVASRVGGVPELLQEDVLFAPDDVSGIAAACYRILTDDDEAIARMRYNLAAASRFDAKTIEERRQAIFEEFKSLARTSGGMQCSQAPIG